MNSTPIIKGPFINQVVKFLCILNPHPLPWSLLLNKTFQIFIHKKFINYYFSGEFIRDLVALESGGSGGVVWRIRANSTKLVCAVGSRNGTEETKLLVLDFDVHDSK